MILQKVKMQEKRCVSNALQLVFQKMDITFFMTALQQGFISKDSKQSMNIMLSNNGMMLN